MPTKCPQSPHIATKLGVFHYRRRLPGRADGEILLSLSTRDWREAGHLGALLDGAFEKAWGVAVADSGGEDRLRHALRDQLREALNEDLRRRTERAPRTAVYAHWWQPGDAEPMRDADLAAIRQARASLENDLARNDPDDLMSAEADNLLARYGIPVDLRPKLIAGLLEAAIRAWGVKEQRTLGAAPLVPIADDPAPAVAVPAAPAQPVPPVPVKPKASELVEAFFVRRTTTDRATHQVMGQERGTLRRFIECCGDKPIDAYNRADITQFLGVLRQLPNTYGRSPSDKDRTLAELVERADARNMPRLSDKTRKRHVSTLSQFLHFAVDEGHLTITARTEMVGGHRFKTTRGAREQRDAWTSAELRSLFASPVWTGCRRAQRSKPGTEVIRDARFWLPVLALFHGARLEELADLYRRDVHCEEGVWAISIRETEGRRLKTDNSARTVPLHPELIRLGFSSYIEAAAPDADDPLFPDLPPQGADGKRGPRLTRWFGVSQGHWHLSRGRRQPRPPAHGHNSPAGRNHRPSAGPARRFLDGPRTRGRRRPSALRQGAGIEGSGGHVVFAEVSRAGFQRLVSVTRLVLRRLLRHACALIRRCLDTRAAAY